MIQQEFFIVGCPRSGTTMLQQALNRHSQIAIPPETAFFTFLGLSRRNQADHLRRINEDLEIQLELPNQRVTATHDARDVFDRLTAQYLARRGKPGVTHFGEKTPEHLSRLDRISEVSPRAKVILIYRDGRDVASSLLGLPWTSRDLNVNFALWLYCYRLQKKAQSHSPLPVLCVRYETLVHEPHQEMRRVLAFLGLSYEPDVIQGDGNFAGIPTWEYDWKARAAERINESRIGLWRKQLSPEQVGIFEHWGGIALRELGYEFATDGKHPLPWFFYLRVAAKSLYWLARRPRYGMAKRLWINKASGDSADGAGPAHHGELVLQTEKRNASGQE